MTQGRRRLGKDDGDLRLCIGCEKWKPREIDFYKTPYGPLGRYARCKKCIFVMNRERKRELRARNGRIKYPSRRHRFGMSKEEYEAFLKKQPQCMICLSTENLVVDHCHTTGKVRAVLCYTCNSGLGFFHDDPQLLANAIEYLRHFKELHNGSK